MPSFFVSAILVAVLSVVLLWADCDIALRFLPYSTADKSFSNKVVWITGASSGIGASLGTTVIYSFVYT